jgi:hypothetical protein
MTSPKSETAAAIVSAIESGDLRRVKSLATTFPDSFENLRYGNYASNNLVDIALRQKHPDIAIYLIVQHGFEVSPEYQKSQKKGGEYFANGCNEYFQTLEVLANIVLGCAPTRQKNTACYELRNWAFAVTKRTLAQDSPTSMVPDDSAIHPEFMKLAASGALQAFVIQKCHDERLSMIGLGHPARMLQALSDNVEAIAAYSRAYLREHPAVEKEKTSARDRAID